MKYSKLFKCGQWWLVENSDESKLRRNLGKCELWAQHVVDALNFYEAKKVIDDE